MKRSFTLALVATAAVAVFAACTGPAGNSLPSSGSGATTMLRALQPDAATSVPRVGHVFAALDFDGTTFTINAHRSCGHRGLGGLTPYTAPTSAPLTLGSVSPSVVPTCDPTRIASTTEIYIFAIPLKKNGSGAGGPHWNAVEVAGPTTTGTNPWIFTAASPGLTMVGGARYDFVIATAYQHKTHPTPAPSSSP